MVSVLLYLILERLKKNPWELHKPVDGLDFCVKNATFPEVINNCWENDHKSHPKSVGRLLLTSLYLDQAQGLYYSLMYFCTGTAMNSNKNKVLKC